MMYQLKAKLVVAPLLLGAIGCKIQLTHESGMKSLDNMTNTDASGFRLNECAKIDKQLGSEWHDIFKSKIVLEEQGDVEKYVNVILDIAGNLVLKNGAVHPLLGMLREDPNSKIYLYEKWPEVKSGEKALCDTFQQTQGVEQNFGCWSRLYQQRDGAAIMPGMFFGPGKLTSGPENDHDISLEKSLRHAFLRSLSAYYFSRVLSGSVDSAALKATDSKDAKASADQDFVAKAGKDLADYADSLLKEFSADIEKNDKFKEVWEKNFTVEEKRMALLTEATDSFYCSGKTRNDFSTGFAKTFARFEK